MVCVSQMSIESVPGRPVSVAQGPITVAESDLMMSELPICSSRAIHFLVPFFRWGDEGLGGGGSSVSRH